MFLVASQDKSCPKTETKTVRAYRQDLSVPVYRQDLSVYRQDLSVYRHMSSTAGTAFIRSIAKHPQTAPKEAVKTTTTNDDQQQTRDEKKMK